SPSLNSNKIEHFSKVSYHLPELPQYHLPKLRGRQGRLEGNPSEIEKKKALHGVNPVQLGKEVTPVKYATL
ncbi:MAG: hypothetical protein KJ573_03565, partial [Proteobacteria bacterium]|nr:hypothetical protein [Pseudomonadota bacterium]MBU1902650.1 hypothetical protein [Pseudomonadota bacterium]